MREHQPSDGDFSDAIRYLNGDTDDAAEDAYFALEEVALSTDLIGALRILERLASGVDQHSLAQFGAGIFETFLAARGRENFDMVEEAIKGNDRLTGALRAVNSLAIPFELALRLSPLVQLRGE